MNKETITNRQAYLAPHTSVMVVELEQSVATASNTLGDFDYNPIFEEVF